MGTPLSFLQRQRTPGKTRRATSRSLSGSEPVLRTGSPGFSQKRKPCSEMSKAFLLSERFEFDSEVSHQLRLPFDSDTPSDFMPTVIYILQCRCNDIHMIVSVSAPAYAETQKIIAIKTIFTCDRITVRKQIPDLTPSDTCFPIQFDSDSNRERF